MSEQVKRYSVDCPLAYPPLDGEREVVLAADYDALRAEAEALRAENGRLASDYQSARDAHDVRSEELAKARFLLRHANELISHGDFDTGVCCCGSSVASHGFGDGHSPVDEGAYYAGGVSERITALLTATPAPEVRSQHAERQEAVAAQQRFRHPQKTAPDWSPWQPAEVDDKRPAWTIDSQGYEVEYRLLYTSPPPAQDDPVMSVSNERSLEIAKRGRDAIVGADQGDRQEDVVTIQRAVNPELVSYAEDMSTCTLTCGDGIGYFYNRVTDAEIDSPTAQDVSGLVEALEEIVKQYPNPDISHVAYRVHACRHAEQALAAYRNPAAVKRCPTCTGTCAEICAKARP